MERDAEKGRRGEAERPRRPKAKGQEPTAKFLQYQLTVISKFKVLKLVAIAIVVGAFAAGCMNSSSKRYVISESKAYEASLFRQNCAICHGPEGEGKTLADGKQTPNLREGDFKYKTDAEIYSHIANGGNGMIPFRGQLTDREINLMVRFVQDELRRK